MKECHRVHGDCREGTVKDDHQHSMCPVGAASCHRDHTLLLLSDALQCNIIPGGPSLGGLMKRDGQRESIELVMD